MDIIRLVLGNMLTNSYIVTEGKEAVVIDPACSAQTLIDAAAEYGAEVKYVLLTHAHFDHIGAVAALQRLGAKVYKYALDCGMDALNDEFFDYESIEPFNADVTVIDGEELSLSGHKYKVIATPGHTPDSVCYVLDDGVIFSGDTLFRASVGRTDFAFGNAADIQKSIGKLFALNGDHAVFAGHGDATTLDFERKFNPYVDRR